MLEPHLAGPFAARAGLDRGGALGAGSFTVRTDFPARDFQLGIFSVDGFFKGQLQVVLEIVASLRPVTASLAPEEIFEDVVEGVAEAAATAESLRSGTLLAARVAEHVIAFALFLIAQRLVGFVDLFEFFFRYFFLRLSRLEIGMVLAGHLAIGLLELVVGGGSFDA